MNTINDTVAEVEAIYNLIKNDAELRKKHVLAWTEFWEALYGISKVKSEETKE